MKSIFLLGTLMVATLLALGLRWMVGKKGLPAGGTLARLVAIGCGGAVVPGAIVLYYVWQGALGVFYYCVCLHNVVPGLKRWGHLTYLPWVFPLSLPLIGAYAFYVFKQARDVEAGTRRAFLLVTPMLYAVLMYSYCPDLTREDNLPLMPLLPMVLAPFVISVGRRWSGAGVARIFFNVVMPLVILAEGVWVWEYYDIRGKELVRLKRKIAAVLKLTDKGDYVMDAKGEFIFRDRPYWWAMETVTRTRIMLGSVKDDVAECLEKTDTKVAYFYTSFPGTPSAVFIAGNYIAFDPKHPDIGVAGKVIGSPAVGEACAFDVAIPARYAVVSETGTTGGELDGVAYAGAVELKTGRHEFTRTAGGGRAAILLERAAGLGYAPQFDDSAEIIKKMGKRAG